MSKPRLLDLYSGAGGAGYGYHLAGFDVTGVDIAPQPRYPFAFVQADALEYLAAHGHEYDAVHASPPCQAHTSLRKMWNARQHADLIPQTRAALLEAGKPYVMENVPGAPLRACLMLCGTMFNLQTPSGAQLQRHRYFETNWFAGMVPPCDHRITPVIGVYGGHLRDRRRTVTVTGHSPYNADRRRVVTVTGSTPQQNVVRNQERETYSTADARVAMGIDWMTQAELSQAIPPAYTRYIGTALRELLAADAQRAARGEGEG